MTKEYNTHTHTHTHTALFVFCTLLVTIIIITDNVINNVLLLPLARVMIMLKDCPLAHDSDNGSWTGSVKYEERGRSCLSEEYSRKVSQETRL